MASRLLYSIYMKKFKLIILTIFTSVSIFASDNAIEKLLDESFSIQDNQARIEFFSSKLLGRKYLSSPLGEGVFGKFDKDPLYRIDAFDCTTFVETVLALSLSRTIQDFKETINQIRYKNGSISFITRNHFISADWIDNNQDLFSDITFSLYPQSSLTAQAIIEKSRWYEFMNVKIIQVPFRSHEENSLLLAKLQKLGQQFANENGSISYLPLSKIFNSLNTADLSLIPSGAIISIVRPNWNIRDQAGTNINVSHQGIAVRENNSLYLRHASYSKKNRKVVQVLLKDYLESFIDSTSIKGINILQLQSN